MNGKKKLYLTGNGFNLNFISERFNFYYPNIDYLKSINKDIFNFIEISQNYFTSFKLQKMSTIFKSDAITISIERFNTIHENKSIATFNIEDFSFLIEKIIFGNNDHLLKYGYKRAITNLFKLEDVQIIESEFNIFISENPLYDYPEKKLDTCEKFILLMLIKVKEEILKKMREDFLKGMNSTGFISKNNLLKDEKKDEFEKLNFENSRIYTTNYDPFSIILSSQRDWEMFCDFLKQSNIDLINDLLSQSGAYGKTISNYKNLHGMFLGGKYIFPNNAITNLLSSHLFIGNPLTSKNAFVPMTMSITYSPIFKSEVYRENIFEGFEEIEIYGLDFLKEVHILQMLIDEELLVLKKITISNLKNYFDENKITINKFIKALKKKSVYVELKNSD